MMRVSSAASSSEKRLVFGESRSNTPRILPLFFKGTTSSDSETESQAMCPGKELTSSILWVFPWE